MKNPDMAYGSRLHKQEFLTEVKDEEDALKLAELKEKNEQVIRSINRWQNANKRKNEALERWKLRLVGVNNKIKEKLGV